MTFEGVVEVMAKELSRIKFEGDDTFNLVSCQNEYIETLDDIKEASRVCNQTLQADHPCFKYCSSVSNLVGIEDKILRLYQLSLEKVDDNGHLKSVPRCGYRGLNSTNNCWTESLTEYGFCYASKPSK